MHDIIHQCRTKTRRRPYGWGQRAASMRSINGANSVPASALKSCSIGQLRRMGYVRRASLHRLRHG